MLKLSLIAVVVVALTSSFAAADEPKAVGSIGPATHVGNVGSSLASSPLSAVRNTAHQPNAVGPSHAVGSVGPAPELRTAVGGGVVRAGSIGPAQVINAITAAPAGKFASRGGSVIEPGTRGL